VPTTGNYFHLHLVSDSTGETLITVARAVAAQYANVTAVEHVYPLVRSQKQLDRVLDEIEEAPGIVLFHAAGKGSGRPAGDQVQGHQHSRASLSSAR
jgi:regulator of PEP synthase PpsR (kinase-PPPase family)